MTMFWLGFACGFICGAAVVIVNDLCESRRIQRQLRRVRGFKIGGTD